MEYKNARNKTNNKIKQAKANYFSKSCTEYKDNPRKLWKTINEITSRKVKNNQVKPVDINNETVSEPSKLAEAFNDYFSQIGENLGKNFENQDESVNFCDYLNPAEKRFAIQPTTTSKVFHLLSKLSETKATGLDNISSKLVKISTSVISVSITAIFNTAISTGIFPDEWKLARVTPIFKNGKTSDLNNYRPISIIPVIAKVFEKVIYDQLYKFLNDNKLLSNCQSGFRSLHSTVTALLKATDDWRLNIDNSLINGVVFLDLKKAFDSVNHSILIEKLRHYGILGRSLDFFISYLANRKQKCRVNGHISGQKAVRCGVPQGSILGPLLFLVFINDFPNCLKYSTPSQYADDTSLTCTADNLINLESQLNTELKHVKAWLSANKLTLNVAKTEFMLITTRQKLPFLDNHEIRIQIDNTPLERVKHTKALGVILHENLSWEKHVDSVRKKVAAGIGLLRRIRDFTSFDILIKIYKALIEPHFDYACTVWDDLDATLALKLQRLQNRAARIITRSDYEVRSADILKNLGWETLQNRRFDFKKRLMIKVVKGEAPQYLIDLFKTRIHETSLVLRNSENKLNLQKPRTDCFKGSFSYSGAALWNNLSAETRASFMTPLGESAESCS